MSNSAWIEDGETVEIVKRGKEFARLIPIAEPAKAAKVDFRAQRRRIWGSRVFSSAEVKVMDDTIDYALSQAERAAKAARLLARPRRNKNELKNVLDPKYDLMALREQEKPRPSNAR